MDSFSTEAEQEAAPTRDRRLERREGSTPWSCVIDPDALDREVDDASDLLDGAATSREDEQRRDYLRRYSQRADGPGLYRREIVADAKLVERLRALRDEVPNGVQVIDVVERAAQLSRHARAPLRVPPLIISGPPGTGKTRLARRIADVLGVSLTVIDGGSTHDSGPITGNALSYKGSGPGKVVRALLEGGTMSPVVLFDEVEKSRGYQSGVRPLDALLPLLEPTTARRFTDEYIGLSADASGVVWICTANSTAALPAPLLDRAIALEMPPLGRAELQRAAQRMLDELLVASALPAASLDRRALAALGSIGLRAARRTLQLALGPALDAGRPAPDASDIAAAAKLVRPPPRRARAKPSRAREPAGFVRFGA